MKVLKLTLCFGLFMLFLIQCEKSWGKLTARDSVIVTYLVPRPQMESPSVTICFSGQLKPAGNRSLLEAYEKQINKGDLFVKTDYPG